MTFAQSPTPQSIAGDWSGELSAGAATLPLVFHIQATPEGKLAATLDSPAQGSYRIPIASVELKGTELKMEAPVIHGTYSGDVSSDGKTITGTWSQGKPLPLVLKQTASAAALAQVKPSPIDGDWSGTLHAGDNSLRLIFHFHAAPDGAINGSLDSVDQGAMGIPCANIKLMGQKLSLSVPSVHGLYEATLSADGDKLSGTWDQGAPLPLELKREPKLDTELIAPAPAKPAVPLNKLQPVLDKEFAPVIAAWKSAGIVVGIFDHGKRKIFAYGTAKPDSIFEIGSVTKTFTGLALAQMVEQKSVTLDEPVRELLPPGTVSKPASGPEITLLDLATQHSGLPRLPDNLRPKVQSDPYADNDPSPIAIEMPTVY